MQVPKLSPSIKRISPEGSFKLSFFSLNCCLSSCIMAEKYFLFVLFLHSSCWKLICFGVKYLLILKLIFAKWICLVILILSTITFLFSFTVLQFETLFREIESNTTATKNFFDRWFDFWYLTWLNYLINSNDNYEKSSNPNKIVSFYIFSSFKVNDLLHLGIVRKKNLN